MKPVYIFIIFVFVGLGANAQKQTFTNSAIIQNGTLVPLSIGKSNVLEDLNYKGIKVNNYISYSPMYWIEFKYDKKSSFYYYNTPFTAKVKLNVKYWYLGASTPSGTQIVELDLKFDPKNDSKNNFLSYQLINPNTSNKIVKVEFIVLNGTNIPTGPISNLFSVSANYLVKYRAAVNFTSINNISHQIIGSKFNVSWNKTTSANNTLLCDEFDFEWAYKDALSSVPISEIKEFSRLTTTNLNIENIPLLYNNGDMLYRIREVYYDYANKRTEGPWTPLQSFSFNQSHEPKLNWTSSISFAEEAKHKEVITYFDGAQRDRQSVTFNTSDAIPIIAESYYDFEGRKAASILPAPHLSQSNIKFYRNFNIDNLSNKPYQATNFSNLVSCSTPPNPLSTSSGASLYYSENNILKNSKFHSFIPNANGYPLTTIEYTNDNTGRITRQSGVGNQFQFGSGQETKYFYGKAFQEEIDRLFGTDVGVDEHYFKNLVLDANGQFSISYLDMSGKTIATSLAGEASKQAIIKNGNNTGKFPMTYKFFKPTSFKSDFRNAKSIASLKHVVTGTQTMKFYVKNDSASHIDVCKKTTCSDCYYDLEINVKSTCITDAQDKNFKLKNYNVIGSDSIVMDTSCITKLKTLNDSFELHMPSGEYDIHASVTIPEKVISFYTNRYLEDGACFPDLDSLKKKHRARMTKCITNCQECMAEYGNVQTTVNRMMAQLIADGQVFSSVKDSLDIRATLQQSADSAKEWCKSYCEPINLCNTTYQALLADVSPGGQYAMYFDTTNMAYYSKPGTTTNSQLPRPSWKLHNSSVTVYKAQNFNNSSTPIKRADGSNFDLNTSEGLKTLSDEWDKSFAEILVKFHPEYCYYQYCANNSNHQKFMDSLEDIDKWSTAVSKGLINTASLSNSINNMVNRDPYFVNGTNNKATVLDSLNNYFTFFDPISNTPIFTLSILDMAILQTNYKLISQNPSSPNITINYTYLDTSSCDGLKNMVWINFKNLYKQVVTYQYEKNRELTCPAISPLQIGKCNKDLNKIDKQSRFFSFLGGISTKNYPHCEKTPRFFKTYEMKSSFMNYINNNFYSSSSGLSSSSGTISMIGFSSSSSIAQAASAAEYKENCDSNCAAMAEGWISILGDCHLKYGMTMDQLKADLIRICQASCVDPLYKQPFGARTTPPGASVIVKGVSCTSFEDVVNLYYDPNIPFNSRACDASLITYPDSFGVSTYYEQRATITKIDECVCNNITQFEQEYDQYLASNPNNPKIVNLYTYLKEVYPEDFSMTVEDFNIMNNSCKNQDDLCTYLEKEIFIPYLFECNTKISCTDLNTANTEFEAKYIDLDETEEEYRRLYRGFMNVRFGMHASFDDYNKFKEKCDDCILKDTVDCATFNKLLNNFLVHRDSIGLPWPGTRENNYDSLTRWINQNYGGTLSVQYIIKMLKNCRPEYAIGDCKDFLDIFYDFRTEYKREFNNDLNLTEMSVTNIAFLRDYFNEKLNRSPKYSIMDVVNLLNNCGVHIKVVLSCEELSAYFFGAFDVKYINTLGTPYGPCISYNPNLLCHAINKHFGTEFTEAYILSLFNDCFKFPPADCVMGGCSISCTNFNTVVNKFMNSAFANGISFPINSKKEYQTFVTKLKNYYNNFSENQLDWTVYCMVNEVMVKKLIKNCDAAKCSNYCDSSAYIDCYELQENRLVTDNILFGPSDTFSTNDINYFNDHCLDCGSINNYLSNYSNTPKPLTFPLSNSFLNTFSAYIPLSKYDLSQNELAILIERCNLADTFVEVSLPIYMPQANCNIYMYNRPLSPRMKPINECAEQQEKLALSAALEEYNKLRQEAVQDFRQKYIAKCLNAANTQVTAKGECYEFQYTLYYYGQDGNLLKTVPPAGVAPIASNDLYLVEAKRKAGQSYVPNHTLETEYKYNSLNQVYEQSTPDAGTSRFVYDELGRLLFSQNAEQAILKNNMKKYSYTIYDQLGRIAESGEIEVTNYFQYDYLFSVNYCTYSTFLNLLNISKPNATYRYVTRTYYDKNKFSNVVPEFSNGIQENLRNRIASITLDTLDFDKGADPATYNTALHYSYDLIGNVHTMVTENNVLGRYMPNQRYKKLEYEYDLVSGKVNKVSYQKAKPDQFLYRYSYDAENRITAAETSLDDIYWNDDANYEYYMHGPLARTVLGEDQVQGLDYAYTLQGWLKSINASTLNAKYDMGNDGYSNSQNKTTARDAMAFSLRYFQNDYTQIGRKTDQVEATLPTAMNSLNLYNGNISSQTVSLKGIQDPTQSYQYRYDQLNRLVQMDAYRPQVPTQTNDMSTALLKTDYQERISYDPNGNILTYSRKKDGGADMDNLTYTYDAQKKNQLKQVQDAVQDGAYNLDIDNQTNIQNYKYDAIGNLIRDEQEDMDISWTPTGKIAKINQNKKKIILTFAYDPMGNRVTKTVTDMLGKKKPFTTYYTRDAQGNTMAVYDNHFYKNMMKICTTYREDVLEAMDRIKEWELQCIGNGDPQCIQSQYESYQQLLAKKDSCKYKVQAYVYSQSQTLPCDLEPQYIDFLEQLYNQDHDSYTQLDPAGQEDYLATKEQEYAPQLNDAMACFMKQLRYIMTMDNSQRDEYINAYRGGLIQELTSHTLFNTINELQLTYGSIIDTSYTDSLYWKEQHLYGSSRLGMAKPNIEVTNYRRSTITAQTSNYKNYELTNHLGNVLATIKDEKQQIDANNDGIVDYYEPIVMTATDYYPFGMPMPNRSFTLAPSEGYRFGFNGKEKESDMYGESNAYDFGARIHDARIGRFLSVDPLSKKYPSESNYSYAGNSPILYVDFEGKSKTYYLTIIKEDGSKTKLTLVDKNDVRLKHVDGMNTPSVYSYDVSQSITVDLRNNTIKVTTGEEVFHFKNRGAEAIKDAAKAKLGRVGEVFSKLDEKTEGDGGLQAGGFRLVSVNGENVGDMSTKMISQNEGLQTLNYDDIADALTAVGSKGKSAGLDGIADVVANIKDIVKSYQDQDPNSAYQFNKREMEKRKDANANSTTRACELCGEKIDKVTREDKNGKTHEGN